MLSGALLAVAACGGASCVCATVDSELRTVGEVRYALDEAGDYWQSPEETRRRGAGDCEDLALYLHRLLKDRGIASIVVFGVQDVTEATTGHAWVECEMYGQMYVLDPTCRLLCRRDELPCHKYYRLLRQEELTRKLADYLARTGEKGINHTFEAAIRTGRGN